LALASFSLSMAECLDGVREYLPTDANNVLPAYMRMFSGRDTGSLLQGRGAFGRSNVLVSCHSYIAILLI
jgi:hypothetical protein